MNQIFDCASLYKLIKTNVSHHKNDFISSINKCCMHILLLKRFTSFSCVDLCKKHSVHLDRVPFVTPDYTALRATRESVDRVYPRKVYLLYKISVILNFLLIKILSTKYTSNNTSSFDYVIIDMTL